MKKYIFPQFKVEIVNPTVSNIHATDNIESKQCTINCTLIDEVGSKFGVVFGPMTYSKTWSDADVIDYVNKELEKYLVQ